MDDEITLEALLDDEDLQSELKSLGWTEPASRSGGSSQRASNKAQNKPPVQSRPSKKVAAERIEEDFNSPFNDAHFDIPSIDHIGFVDESSIKLEDHDMNDPELLSMYRDLEGNSEEETEDENDNDNANKKAASSSVSGHNESISRVVPDFTSESVTNASNDILNYSNISAEEATQKALQFRRDGNTAEALKWFRLSKQLQNAKGREKNNSIPLKSATGTVPAQTAAKSGPPTKPSRNDAPIQTVLPTKSVSTAKSILEKGNFVFLFNVMS
jgi:hypothetical protein